MPAIMPGCANSPTRCGSMLTSTGIKPEPGIWIPSSSATRGLTTKRVVVNSEAMLPFCVHRWSWNVAVIDSSSAARSASVTPSNDAERARLKSATKARVRRCAF